MLTMQVQDAVQFGSPNHYWIGRDESVSLPLRHGLRIELLNDDTVSSIVETLPALGSGVSRTVYAIDEDYVLKVNHNSMSHAGDCKSEAIAWETIKGSDDDGYFAQVVHASESGKWLIMRRADVGACSERERDMLDDIADGWEIRDIHSLNVGLTDTGSPVIVDYALNPEKDIGGCVVITILCSICGYEEGENCCGVSNCVTCHVACHSCNTILNHPGFPKGSMMRSSIARSLMDGDSNLWQCEHCLKTRCHVTHCRNDCTRDRWGKFPVPVTGAAAFWRETGRGMCFDHTTNHRPIPEARHTLLGQIPGQLGMMNLVRRDLDQAFKGLRFTCKHFSNPHRGVRIWKRYLARQA